MIIYMYLLGTFSSISDPQCGLIYENWQPFVYKVAINSQV